MKKLFITLACLCVLPAAVSAADVPAVTNAVATTNAVAKRKPTPEEFRKALALARMKKTGGFVRRAGSAKGCFVVLNGQRQVPDAEVQKALGTLDRQVKVQTRLVAATGVGVDNVRDKIRGAGGAVGVALVESESLPTLIAAPETGWAIVNVSALAAGADAKCLAERVRKEVLRGFAFVVGGCYSPFGDFLMRDVTEPVKLDVTEKEEFSIAMLQRFSQALGNYGLVPWYETTYVKACEEGWAPAATNEYQKALWDKVHAIPQNPMKIEYDPKKGR